MNTDKTPIRAAHGIYFAAITVLCESLTIAISWFDRIIHPGAYLPALTQGLIDYRAVLYAVPRRFSLQLKAGRTDKSSRRILFCIGAPRLRNIVDCDDPIFAVPLA